MGRTYNPLRDIEGTTPLLSPQPTECAADLVTRGKALQSQGKHADALLLFERATPLDPNWFTAWFNLGYSLLYSVALALEQMAQSDEVEARTQGDLIAWFTRQRQ